MNLIPNEFYHVYNRGNNKQKIFFSDNNYLFFLKKVRDQISPVCRIIAYCLMPNHFHFIIMATKNSIHERPSFGGKPMQEFAYRIGILLSSYSQAINMQNKTTGSLFQQKTKAKILAEKIDDKYESYFVNCLNYLDRNPLQSGIVNNLKEWQYSSYPDYSGSRNGSLCDKKIFFALTGLTESEIIKGAEIDLDNATIAKFY